VPVATMAIGAPGARNAAILAAQILALGNPSLAASLRSFKQRMEKEIEEKNKKIHSTWP